MFYWFSYCVAKMLGMIFAPRTVLGSKYIPKTGGFLIACNHVSNLDPFLIGLSLRRRISYMAKDTLFHNAILKFMLDRVEAFPVRRETSDIRALRETLRRLKRGSPVVMFPEGTRRVAGSGGKTQSGVGFLALKADVPVLPVYIHGSDQVLPPGASVPRRSRVTVIFGEPLVFSKKQSYPEIMNRIMREIRVLANQNRV